MFASIRGFLYRNRRKFLWAGAAAGGAVLVSKLVEIKLRQWQETEAKKLMEQQRRKRHYERTLETTRISLHQLLPNVRKVLETELDSEVFIRAIKEHPERKREYWEQLKLVGFGRSLCMAVCSAVIAAISHVLMTVLAAHTLDGNTPIEVQTRFLSSLQGLVEEKLPRLVEKIMAVASKTVTPIPLTRKLTMNQLEIILQEVSLAITNNREVCDGHVDAKDPVSILPWSRYLKEPEPIHEIPQYNEQLRKMYLVTVDVLNTDDFNDVVNTLAQVGVSYVLDEMAAFYFSSCFPDQHKSQESNQHCVEESSQKNDDGDQVKRSETGCEDSSASSVAPCGSGADTSKKVECPGGGFSTNNPSCVLVKLVPILSGVLHIALPNLPANGTSPACNINSFYHRIIACSQLETLAFSVYDALVLTTRR
ncbi:Peroxin-3, partial [Trinorchestia longiramus]